MSAAVSVHDLVISYAGQRAVDGVSFTVATGDVCVLLGPNGAGKTSTLRVLLGLLTPDSGTVELLGHHPTREAALLRRQVGVVLQDGGAAPAEKPMQTLRHFAALHKDPLPVDDLGRYLALDGLTRPYKRLSGGEQQRVKLALALVGRPRLLILDEPTTGMDPGARRQFWSLVDTLRESGVTLIMTTHQPDEIVGRADQVVVINQGRIVAAGTPGELMDQGPTWFTSARHLDLSSLRAVLPENVLVDEPEPGRYRVVGPVGVAEMSAIRSWVAQHGQGSVDRSLEQTYLALTSEVTW